MGFLSLKWHIITKYCTTFRMCWWVLAPYLSIIWAFEWKGWHLDLWLLCTFSSQLIHHFPIDATHTRTRSHPIPANASVSLERLSLPINIQVYEYIHARSQFARRQNSQCLTSNGAKVSTPFLFIIILSSLYKMYPIQMRLNSAHNSAEMCIIVDCHSPPPPHFPDANSGEWNPFIFCIVYHFGLKRELKRNSL